MYYLLMKMELKPSEMRLKKAKMTQFQQIMCDMEYVRSQHLHIVPILKLYMISEKKRNIFFCVYGRVFKSTMENAIIDHYNFWLKEIKPIEDELATKGELMEGDL